jgi:mevalonate kinase
MGQKARTIQNKIADFILVDAGTRKGTAELVKSVRGFKNKNLGLWNDFAKSIDDMACKAESTLQGSGDNPLKEMARIIFEAQRILKELNLSTPMIDEIISVAKQAGVWAGKVSGAGTGGATVLMCAAGESPRISEKLKSKNINVLTVVTSHG